MILMRMLFLARSVCLPMSSLALLALITCTPYSHAAENQLESVSALGRLQPKNGIMTIGVASTPEALSGSLLSQLFVAEGDYVEVGQVLAITDSAAPLQARLDQANSELQLARQAAIVSQSRSEEACVIADVAAKEAQRRQQLHSQDLASEEETESAQGRAKATAASCKTSQVNMLVANADIEVAQTRIAVAQAQLARATVLSPYRGLVLEIMSYPGEFVGVNGLLKLGRVDQMYAVAEIYETDVSRIKIGQSASIHSTALASDLTGKVELIRHMVRKQDVTGTDPAANRDARIIEVEILLDDPESAASLSNLQVEIVIDV